VELPCTAEEYFTLCLADNSKFAEDYCAERKDTDLHVEKWCEADKNHRMVRMVTYKSLCTSPMCPPDTAVTVWQQAAFSDDKKALVLEFVSQAHDVPFGSCFEVTLYSQPGPTAQKFFDLNAHVCMEFVLALVGSITQGPKFRFT
jgi:hypothetical protein